MPEVDKMDPVHCATPIISSEVYLNESEAVRNGRCLFQPITQHFEPVSRLGIEGSLQAIAADAAEHEGTR